MRGLRTERCRLRSEVEMRKERWRGMMRWELVSGSSGRRGVWVPASGSVNWSAICSVCRGLLRSSAVFRSDARVSR